MADHGDPHRIAADPSRRHAGGNGLASAGHARAAAELP